MKPWTPRTPSTRKVRNSEPGKSSVDSPVHDSPDADGERSHGAHRPDHDAGPLDRSRPEAGEDVEREPGEPQRRVARPSVSRAVRQIDLRHARSRREDERLGELLLADHAEHRQQRLAAVRVEGAAEVGDVDAREAPEHAVDQPGGQRPAPRVLAAGAPPARYVGARLDCGDRASGGRPDRSGDPRPWSRRCLRGRARGLRASPDAGRSSS